MDEKTLRSYLLSLDYENYQGAVITLVGKDIKSSDIAVYSTPELNEMAAIGALDYAKDLIKEATPSYVEEL